MTKDAQISELINTVVKILQQQMSKYTQIMEIDKAILKMDDELVNLEKQLETRNSLFTQLANMTDLIESYRAQIAKSLKTNGNSWAKVLEAKNFNGKEHLSKILQSLHQNIEEIIELEREVTTFLESRMAEVYKEIKSITQYRELEQAYHDKPEKFPEPQVFDKIK